MVPVGRSARLQSRLWGRGQTSACSPGRSWARHWLFSQSDHSRPDLCLHQDSKHTERVNASTCCSSDTSRLFIYWPFYCFDSVTVFYGQFLNVRRLKWATSPVCGSISPCFCLLKTLAKTLTLQMLLSSLHSHHKFSRLQRKHKKWK